MYLLCLWIGKSLRRMSRLVGNSGAALPGYVIQHLSADFLEQALGRLPGGVVVISGTNGKTTTTKLITDSLKASGLKVLTNATGSNMTRGLISTVVARSRLSGKLDYDLAVLEIDEAYAGVLAASLPIRGAVVLNVMRDQLDRFGEIDTTAAMLGKLTAAAKEFVVLNAQDSRVSQLPTKAGHKLFFAAGSAVAKQLVTEADWEKQAAAEMPKAGYILEHSQGQVVSISRGAETLKGSTELQGVHNHLNLIAALAAIQAIRPDMSLTAIFKLLAQVQPAFGRSEVINLGRTQISLQLFKNPSSATQTLMAADVSRYDRVFVLINDAYADSRDVSWLWDVDWSELQTAKRLICGGSRAYDMAVRLKYMNLKPEAITTDMKQILSLIGQRSDSVAVFCSYTAMLKLRGLLVRRGAVRQVG